MTKLEMTEAIITAKLEKGTTWEAVGKAIGLSDIFTASACLGQNSLSKEDATKLAKLLDLGNDVVTALTVCPMKGLDTDLVSKDPLIYRFYEIAYVYGGAIKECIHEKFGDGIMSAIDFTCDIEKQEDPKGDRVVVTMNGKFLPYKKW
ncbi:cyanase [Rubritalea profundi]|uniref:Cyanate hydratase n=1 Tax=Rubritalea profundi TaxID=1658618 RepID=A0A2S7U565_9BACT|nr:cyanase [Rubritalea profundi]PQJ30156.1 cyanase [Rubritalea profundi]